MIDMNEILLLLDKLGLAGMKGHLPDLVNSLNKESSEECCLMLKKLLEIECEYKKSRSLHYRLGLAKLPTIKLISETSQSKLVEDIDVRELVTNKQNILLIGGSGSAKTHLAIGLTFNAIQKNCRARFYNFNELATQLLNARKHNYEIRYMESVKRFDLIIVDELGYVPIKAESGPLLFELFSKLYEQTSIIITTHLRFEEWGNMFGNAKATKAIIDRLTHHCKIIETGNKSFRGDKAVDKNGGKNVK